MSRYKNVRIPLAKANVSETSYFLSASLALLEQNKLDLSVDPLVEQAIGNIRSGLSRLEASQRQPTDKKALKLSDLDKQLNSDWRDLRTFVRLQTKSRQTNKSQAALMVWELLEANKDIIQLKYSEQVALVQKFLATLEQKDYKSRLTLIGASEYVANLKDSHAIFYQTYLQLMADKQAPRADSPWVVKNQLLKDYDVLYTYLLCLYYMDNNHATKPILASLNTVRQDYRSQLKRQEGLERKKGQSGKKD